MELEHRRNIILYNVLNQEVVFEEYFCNLLRIDCFRRMFIEFISKQNSILDNLVIKYENFDTEIPLKKKRKKYGRADLFLQVEEQEFIFEIKNKEWTDLTVNQPTSYLKYLNNKNEHLFFMIPKGYKHKDEIISRWKDFSNVENQIFYWEDIIKEIENTNLHQENIEIKMFFEFCQYWFELEIIKFKEEEMKLLNDVNLPSLMQKLEEITRKISSKVGLNDKFGTIGFMHTLKVKGYRVYFGIDYDIWKEKKLPLSILIQSHKEDYQKFNLTLDDIKLDEMEYAETNVSDKQFGYVVILNEEIGSDDYEKIVVMTLKNIINQLTNTTK